MVRLRSPCPTYTQLGHPELARLAEASAKRVEGSLWMIYARDLFFFLLRILILFLSKILGISELGNLPGDILFKKGGFSFHFPIVTCIIMSVVLTIFFQLINF